MRDAPRSLSPLGSTRGRREVGPPHVLAGFSAPKSGSVKPFLAALAGEPQKTPPIWLMRQAGRYLPEYRDLRARASTFLDFCYDRALAVEATLQPVRRFGFDAAILFSDILVLPDALGQRVDFETGDGPRLDPIGDAEGLAKLSREPDWRRLAPVFEAVDRVKGALPKETALIGFCGAPWTVASYMIAGRGTPDQAPARLFAYRHPDLFAGLIDRLVDASAEYLCRQFAAGADAAQIFDSWAGVLPPAEFERWCVAPIAAIAAKVRAETPNARLIAFPRGAGDKLTKFGALAEIDAIGLDTAVEPKAAVAALPERLTLQGNLDPLALVAGGRRLDEEIDRVLSGFSSRAHIFNLGHGVLPETPIDHVERLVARVRGERAP
jgi:uroporphyrinogen decarboxylase